MAKLTWWDPTLLQEGPEKAPLFRMFLSQAAQNEETVFSGTCRGLLEEPDKLSEFLLSLKDSVQGSALLSAGPIFGRGVFDTWVTWDEGAITVQIGVDQKLTIHVMTTDEGKYNAISSLLGDEILPDHVRQPVYSLAEGPLGIEIVEIGTAGSEFQRENYEEEIGEAFDFIHSELERDPPLGRLSIIEGDPGCGKTFFVRGLLSEVLDAIFVLVPPHLVEGLSGPQLVPMLVRARGMAGSSKPIVLVIEDADKALVPREDGSLAAISSLLNVSDGILGHTLNVRVICTTNAKLEQIDPALKRPGRLSKHIHIGELSMEKAAEVFSRITEGDDANFTSETGTMSLAQVYQFALQLEIEEDGEDEDDDDDDDDDDDEDDD